MGSNIRHQRGSAGMLSPDDSLSLVSEMNDWCDKTGCNYNRLALAASISVSTRSEVKRGRCLTEAVADRVRRAMKQHPNGIPFDKHKRRLQQERNRITQQAREPEPRRVNRDPCPLCAVRADIGCKHQGVHFENMGVVR